MSSSPSKPSPPENKPSDKPGNPPPEGTRPKKKLELDVNDVDAILERKISP